MEIKYIPVEGLIQTYHIRDIENYEEFINALFAGLAHHRKQDPDMIFKIIYTPLENEVIVKKFHRVGSSN